MTEHGATAVISGALTGYKTMADGTLRLTIDLPENQSRDFHSLFPAVHCLVAVAPLRDDSVSEAEVV